MISVNLASTYAADGGAARAALRLLCALRGAGADASLLCQFPGHPEAGVVGPRSKGAKVWAQAGRLFEDYVGMKWGHSASLFSPAIRSWGSMGRQLTAADGMLHLHWVQKGFLSIEDIGKIERPFVWTFHDMWPLTSGNHYGDVDSMKRPRSGLARSIWRRKERAWGDLAVTVVTPSRWLAELAALSPFFQGRPIRVIPNAIDIDLYRPLEGP